MIPSTPCPAIGFYVLVHPGLSLFALVYTIGFYALIAGIALLGLATKLKQMSGPHLHL